VVGVSKEIRVVINNGSFLMEKYHILNLHKKYIFEFKIMFIFCILIFTYYVCR